MSGLFGIGNQLLVEQRMYEGDVRGGTVMFTTELRSLARVVLIRAQTGHDTYRFGHCNTQLVGGVFGDIMENKSVYFVYRLVTHAGDTEPINNNILEAIHPNVALIRCAPKTLRPGHRYEGSSCLRQC